MNNTFVRWFFLYPSIAFGLFYFVLDVADTLSGGSEWKYFALFNIKFIIAYLAHQHVNNPRGMT
jgi:hypothetical protein